MSIVEKLGFTPGPWEKDYGATDGHIKQIHGRTDGNTPTIAKYDIMKRYDFKEHQLISDNEIEANGHLIAAAPEMLEDEIENIKLLKHLLSFPALKNCVGSKTIDWIEGRLFSTETIIEKLTGKSWEEIKELI